MTNTHTIKISALEQHDVIIDPDGNAEVVQRIRLIDHERCRIDTKSGKARIAYLDDDINIDSGV